jgi:hypothetical protein
MALLRSSDQTAERQIRVGGGAVTSTQFRFDPHRAGQRRESAGSRRLRHHARHLFAFHRSEEWAENEVRFQMRGFGQSATGTITVVGHSVQIEVTLPWVLAKIAERFLPAMRRETTLLLEPK